MRQSATHSSEMTQYLNTFSCYLQWKVGFILLNHLVWMIQ